MHNKKIKDFFPKETPRKSQLTAFEWLEEQDAKYLLLESPVGSGKSDIGISYSRWLTPNGKGNSFILTPQKILQTQYEESFDNSTIASLYGRSNYDCHPKNTDCKTGKLIKPDCKSCPHRAALGYAKTSKNVVFNYTLALLIFTYNKHSFPPRKLMVLDECHTVERHLTEFSSIQISKKRSEKFHDFRFIFHKDITKGYKWLKEEYIPALKKYVDILFYDVEKVINNSSHTPTEVKLIKEYNNMDSHAIECEEFVYERAKTYEKEFVLIEEMNGFRFKPLKGKENFKKILDTQAEQFLFMSSTILDKDQYCNDIGLPSKDTAFLSLDSEFKTKNRPVYFMPQMKMNASWKRDENSTNRKNMLKTLIKLFGIHKLDNGIIHTGNFKIAEWVIKELEKNKTHRLLHHNPGSIHNRDAIIRQFMGSKKPTILVSPSITEGLDLKNDLSRFCIILKVPFGNLMDAWIKKRLEISDNWYKRNALIDIIQGTGRIMRSKDDWGTTYILDESWGYLFQTTRRMVPKWWMDAYKKI